MSDSYKNCFIEKIENKITEREIQKTKRENQITKNYNDKNFPQNKNIKRLKTLVKDIKKDNFDITSVDLDIKKKCNICIDINCDNKTSEYSYFCIQHNKECIYPNCNDKTISQYFCGKCHFKSCNNSAYNKDQFLLTGLCKKHTCNKCKINPVEEEGKLYCKICIVNVIVLQPKISDLTLGGGSIKKKTLKKKKKKKKKRKTRNQMKKRKKKTRKAKKKN